MSFLKENIEYLTEVIDTHRVRLFWAASFILLLLLAFRVQEVSVLLLASYGIALLLDPILGKLSKFDIGRTVGLFLIGFSFLLFAVLVFFVAVPSLVEQYATTAQQLPDYAQELLGRLKTYADVRFGFKINLDPAAVVASIRQQLSLLEVEQVSSMLQTLRGTLLRGYSLTLTVINIFLLPFFVFYIARDLPNLHQSISTAMSTDLRQRVQPVCSKILEHIHAFFKGQVTVAILLAVLYSIGLSMLGLPSALFVGCLTGLLNIVPYLGVGIGLILATALALLAAPGWSLVVSVWILFLVVQLVEGNFLTPKIVGDSVGIHPLGVMIALIVGGDLFGLLGIILAIPAAASAKVLFDYFRTLVENTEGETEELENMATPKSSST